MFKPYFLLLLILSIPLWATAQVPWSKPKSRTSPWQKSEARDRVERRTQFFKDLGEAPIVTASQDERKVLLELSDLPWSAYDQEFNKAFDQDLLWPVRNGIITSGFGIRHGRPHEGLDIKSDMGTEIRAVTGGRVVFEGHLPGYGKTLVIAHGHSYTSVYAHNLSHLVQRGDFVRKGQPIAKLGNSGKTTGAHLHFEIRVKGQPVNPLRFHFKERWIEASSL